MKGIPCHTSHQYSHHPFISDFFFPQRAPAKRSAIPASSKKKPLSTMHMSKEQRERKRLINRLSAQRKRQRDRNQLDTLTDQQGIAHYLNESLQLDNERLTQLTQQLQEIVHPPTSASASEKQDEEGTNNNNSDSSSTTTDNNHNNNKQKNDTTTDSSLLGTMFVKMDTLERLQTCLQKTISQSLPVHITAFAKAHEEEVPLQDNPFTSTSEYLHERLLVLERSKELMMDPSKASSSSDSGKTHTNPNTTRGDSQNAQEKPTNTTPAENTQNAHATQSQNNPPATATTLPPLPTAMILPHQTNTPLGGDALTKEHILHIFAGLDATTLQHILHLAQAHGLVTTNNSLLGTANHHAPSSYPPLAMYHHPGAASLFGFPPPMQHPASAFPPQAAPGGSPTTTTTTAAPSQQPGNTQALTAAPPPHHHDATTLGGPSGMPPPHFTAAAHLPVGPHHPALDPRTFSFLSQQHYAAPQQQHHGLPPPGPHG